MDKEMVYKNIYNRINNGTFLDKYMELTGDKLLESDDDFEFAENIAAKIFNAILIGSQLFYDDERINRFVDTFSHYLDAYSLEMFLPGFEITEQEALERLKHGFGVHFTTVKICDIIKNNGHLVGYGKNAMFTDEENHVIDEAAREQKVNNPTAEQTLNYLFRGFGTGVSSYGSMTNGFWMYHTPESLSFLFGNISKRSKVQTMNCVRDKISALSDSNKKKTFDVMKNIYDRLIGEEQEVGCILIDRDAFKYEVDYYYGTGEPVAVERRPYSRDLNSLMLDDCKITNDIDVSGLRFLKIPTILELERQKQQILQNQVAASKIQR